VVKTKAVVVVEGDSDRVALETLARRRGRDLAAEGVEIVPIGGAHAIRRYLEKLKANGSEVKLAGLVDAGQEDVFRRAVDHTGFEIDLYVCDTDLEDELIRAVGLESVEDVIEAQGDLRSLRSLPSAAAPPSSMCVGSSARIPAARRFTHGCWSRPSTSTTCRCP
jgi:hypothetical protein